MRDRRVAPDLPAVAGVRAAGERALRAVDLADRIEHRERRLVARTLRHLRLGDADARVALEEPVREVAPADALADERDLRLRLDRHLRLDLLDDADDRRARELRERRPAVAEDPRVAVLVGADRSREAHVGERRSEDVVGARIARVLEVVLDAVERRARLRVLHLEARDDERPRPVPAEDAVRSAARSARTRSPCSRGRRSGRRARHPTGRLPAPVRGARRSERGAPPA